MHADELLRPFGRCRHFGDAQRGSVRCEDRVWRASPIEPRKDLELQLDFLRYRFNDKVGIRDRACNVGFKRQARKGGIHFGVRHFSELDGFLEVQPDSILCFLEKVGRDIVQNRIQPADRRHVRDAAAHDSRANHSNVRDVFFVRHAA